MSVPAASFFRVRTRREHLPITGQDSCIATVPAGLIVEIGGKPAINIHFAARMLRDLSESQASLVGWTLHHAEWQLTDDPDTVDRVGMHGNPDCARCRASVDQALARLAETGETLLVGILYWAQVAPTAAPG